MEDFPANIRVSISDDVNDISGSETFVTSQIANLKQVLSCLKSSTNTARPSPASSILGLKDDKPVAGITLDREQIFAFDGDKLKMELSSVQRKDLKQ